MFETEATNLSETMLGVYLNPRRDIQQDININLQILLFRQPTKTFYKEGIKTISDCVCHATCFEPADVYRNHITFKVKGKQKIANKTFVLDFFVACCVFLSNGTVQPGVYSIVIITKKKLMYTSVR
jgi:hypothetical protein